MIKASPLLWRWRTIKDALARYGMAVGGVSVIAAITLIFFYLLYVVVPLFVPAEVEDTRSYPLPAADAGQTLHLAIEEQGKIGARITRRGTVVFFDTASGETVLRQDLSLPAGTTVTGFAAAAPTTTVFALGLSDGRILIARHSYRMTYSESGSVIHPEISYPLDEAPLPVDEQRRPIVELAIRSESDQVSVLALPEGGAPVLLTVEQEQSFLDDEVTLTRTVATLPLENMNVDKLLLAKDQRTAYVVGKAGGIAYFDISDKGAPRLIQRLAVTEPNTRITAVDFLAGGISLLIGDSTGKISQWFPVRDERNNFSLTPIREFQARSSPVMDIAAEHRRKGFAAVDAQGHLAIFHATAHQEVLATRVTDRALTAMAIAPRANALVVQDETGQLHFVRIHNEHPEASWSSLWGKVWYESYPEPDYIWQSSSASNDFEPKFSLVPLTFGTIKAAFYAMLFAVPLAICGAVYTAYFMAPRMRQYVKPSVEIMEALPTVILGFLAGLWLAPFIESNLAGIFAFLMITPLAVLAFAYLWDHMTAELRHRVGGWQAAVLIPVICIIGWLAFAAGPVIESAFFGGDIHLWFNRQGIEFDQRNAIVVGVAMGFAVIPTIFSIAEDAIFSVPGHLTRGSLALGATPWQTLVRVVLLTASPGIFSAVMIGLGRAVGETMIVLMATGNTPVMDLSIFEGMRTLSANIAVEMPESEVDSTHYRILFLAALVLFIFTFFVNTLAEVVRQRLRRKYSSL